MIDVYKTVYREALNYLTHKAGANFVADQLKDNTKVSPAGAKNMKALFRIFIDAVICTKKMREAIGPVDRLQNTLFEFNPVRIYSHYKEKWELLAGDIQRQQEIVGSKSGNSSDDSWAYWETFGKTALSVACFLAQLKTVKTFKGFVRGFEYNEMTAAVLPLLLQKEIYSDTLPA